MEALSGLGILLGGLGLLLAGMGIMWYCSLYSKKK
jgi:hypothetical protein